MEKICSTVWHYSSNVALVFFSVAAVTFNCWHQSAINLTTTNDFVMDGVVEKLAFFCQTFGIFSQIELAT